MNATWNCACTSCDCSDFKHSLRLVHYLYHLLCFKCLRFQSFIETACDFRLVDKKWVWYTFILIEKKARICIKMLYLLISISECFVTFSGQSPQWRGIVKLIQLVQVLENLENPGVLLWHFPGLQSSEKRQPVLESSGNLFNSWK